MINLTPEQLNTLAKERLDDAKALYAAGRYEGAFYICGYALEMKLKCVICKTLGWDEYPGDGKEKNKSFKTHKFDDLLHLSGVEKRVRATLIAEWSIVVKWDPEIRYSSGRQTAEDVKLVIEAAETLLAKL
ncbi:MAG: HEPN domain-containing protein [Chlamydiales bacterium]|nr:HEPN domain-containing protein [Chlamydiales bacterium]